LSSNVLIVDDEAVFRVLAEEALTAEGFDVRTAPTLRKARAHIEATNPDLLILDRRLPDGDGIEFLRGFRHEGPNPTDVIVVTAYGDIGNAVDALKAGASDYLTKPIQATDLIVKVHKVLEGRTLRDRLALARSRARGPLPPPVESELMRRVMQRVEVVSGSPGTPVLMVGPSGSGKQWVAEALHDLTYPDSDAPFVDFSCGSFEEDLAESELFGHERGAFADGRAPQRGLVELAVGGTLFIDEVSDLPLPTQAKLLKFLDTRRFRRLAGHRDVTLDLRVIAATSHDLDVLVDRGRFREDLYHRLSVFEIAVPPLSSRREDIPGLAASFAAFFAERLKRGPLTLSSDALRLLSSYPFPGNVRELRNIVERAAMLAPGRQITAGDILLPPEGPPAGEPSAFFSLPCERDGAPMPLEGLKVAYVERVMNYFNGNRASALRSLGVSYPTLLKRLREIRSRASTS
jgi:DNA-binding NtrC family response regulator